MEIKLVTAKNSQNVYEDEKQSKINNEEKSSLERTRPKKISSKTRLGDGSSGEYYRLCLSLFAYSFDILMK